MNSKDWYPLRFQPILKEKIWGGNSLKTFLNKSEETLPFGESWEIADLPDNQSLITNGHLKGKELGEVVTAFAKAILGTSVAERFGANFPLLIKYIDAADDLSVQLHPDDILAEELHNGKGKTEMWYILKATPNAQLIIGFKDEMTLEQFDTCVANTSINDHLQYINVQEGDSFFISAGLIHAIGKGIVLAEIQQTSDITYRVFDYNRKQQDGTLRDLHIDHARKALKFKTPEDYILSYDRELVGAQELKHGAYFKTDIIYLKSTSHAIKRTDSFTVIMMVLGSITYTYKGCTETLRIGETLLIPADCTECIIQGNEAKFLEVYL